MLLHMISSTAAAQNTKTWVGPAAGLWSTAANWSPSGIPASTDTVIFNSNNICDMDVNPVIASLRATGLGGNIIASGGLRSLTIDNAGAASPVLSVASGSSLSMGNGGFGINFSTYGPSGPNNAQVAGTLFLGYSSAWTVNNVGATNITNVDVSGTIWLVAVHTGLLFNNSTTGTVRFLSGSSLTWGRNGGVIPIADYQDGSTINVTGVTSNMPVFSAGSNFNGLLIWNSTSQTISGSSSVLLPTSSYAMDSIRVISTGSGSLRMFGAPSGYTIGHLEVQGGVTELGAPASVPGTCTINTGLKISAGTVYGNAFFAGDAGFHFPMTITVNGGITVTGGTFDLTNRVGTLNPGAACIVNVKGDITQTAGTITATTAFGAQNQFNLNGTAVQNIQLSSFTNTVSLVVSNSTNGASLQSNIVLPYILNLFSGGFIQLNNFNLSVAAGLVFSSGNGKAVTNGTGALTVTGVLASATQSFPVAPSSTTYNPVTLVPSAGAFSPNNYAVRVETGLNPLIAYPLYAVNRTWTVTASTTPAAPVSTALQYSNTDGTAGFTYGVNVDHGVYFGGGWNVDATNITPVFSSPNYTVTTNVVSLNGGVGLPMVIGNMGSILNTTRSIDLTAVKQTDKALLSWTLNTGAAIREITIQRSGDGRNFETLATVPLLTSNYTDDKLLVGTNYYRIRATDINGRISFSAVVAVISSDAGFDIVSLLPNIVRDHMQLNIAAAQKARLDVAITDVAGRPVTKLMYQLVAGSNLFDISTARLPAGLYWLTATTAAGEVKTLRFVKQ